MSTTESSHTNNNCNNRLQIQMGLLPKATFPSKQFPTNLSFTLPPFCQVLHLYIYSFFETLKLNWEFLIAFKNIYIYIYLYIYKGNNIYIFKIYNNIFLVSFSREIELLYMRVTQKVGCIDFGLLFWRLTLQIVLTISMNIIIVHLFLGTYNYFAYLFFWFHDKILEISKIIVGPWEIE